MNASRHAARKQPAHGRDLGVLTAWEAAGHLAGRTATGMVWVTVTLLEHVEAPRALCCWNPGKAMTMSSPSG